MEKKEGKEIWCRNQKFFKIRLKLKKVSKIAGKIRFENGKSEDGSVNQKAMSKNGRTKDDYPLLVGE